jgi:hypothetical protein
MKRIWFDRIAEYDYLEKKSRTISDSLGQFLHRAKALIPHSKGRQEIQILYENIYRQIQPTRKVIKKN